MPKPGFILFLFLPFNLLAQLTPNPDWRFENFNSQNHFISRDILTLTMDKHGYLWTCNRGVQRFDGNKTIEYNSLGQEKGALKGNYTEIITDNDGRVWISSLGLCYYDDDSGKFIYVQPDSKHLITYVQSFYIEKNYLWFVCDYGLAKLNLRSLKISFTSLTDVADPLCINLLNDNTLIIPCRGKVYTYNIKNNRYLTNTLIFNYSLLKIASVCNSGVATYIATNHGLFILKSLHNLLLPVKQTEDIELNDLLFLPGDKKKEHLLLATERKGILVYNTLSKKVEFNYVHDYNNIYSIPNNSISKFYLDKYGRLWLSTGLGVSMLDVNNQQVKMRYMNKNYTDEIYINKIVQDKYDSTKVWMSSYNQGMICINWKNKKIAKMYNADPEIRKVYDFSQLTNNKWLIVTQKKILEWDSQSGIQSRIKLPICDSLSLTYTIHNIIMTGANTCFITTNRGLFKYDLITHHVSVASENTKSKEIEDRQYDLNNGFVDKGILWIASRNGIFSYDIKLKKTKIYRGNGKGSDYYFFNISDAINNQILCATSSGIAIFNKKTGNFRIINTIANLTNPSCGSVISVNNIIWIATEVGIFNYDLNKQQFSRYEHETLLMQTFPASQFTPIGKEIVLGFRNGYAYFSPDLKHNLVPSDPIIETFFVNNRPVLKNFFNQNNIRELIFNHSDNSININFTAFLYTDPGSIKFRYRLNGVNETWHYVEDQRSANYAQLSPGNYTFYVECGNKNGIWNNHMAFVSFIIKPPYWETWWFRTLLMVATAIVLYSIYRYRIKSILAIQKIREKIASDFHDDIGSALSSISIFSEVADKQLKQQLPAEQTREIIGHISFHSRAMLDSMDDIIWAVNPQNDHFNDLAVRMREFAIPLLEAKNIQFEINIPEDLLSTRVKMDSRKNIFLIFKECINNILKHSGCSAMEVTVTKKYNQLEFVISDNGQGFEVDGPNTRNGLKNMQKRAREINGTLQIKSGKCNGTVTTLLINII